MRSSGGSSLSDPWSLVARRARLAAAVLLALVGCGPSSDAQLAEPLLGEWRWIETGGGSTGETRRDPSHRWRLRLGRDGSIREEYEGRPAASGTYRVRSDGAAAAASLVLELGGDLVVGRDQPFQIHLAGDSLLLVSPSDDGYSYRFVRVDGP